ncbi:MAG: monovalent cation/H+ antiporter complex subunit F [Halobacteriales archaeon]|nr:monovalent cation/H+ antiporter complex subunit F [Halobacteriales archaeon]
MISVESTLIGAAAAVTVLAVVVLYRVVRGPTVQDRIIAINVLGTSTVVIIAFVAGALDRPFFLDIAIVYALLNFLISIAAAKLTIDRGEVL